MNAAVALLEEVPSLRQRISPVSVAEYHRMPERNENGRRTELIRGVIIEKMPASPIHAVTVDRFCRMLFSCLGTDYYVRQEHSLTLRDSAPEPDLAVIAGAAEDFTEAHPTTALLAVEVSVTTLETDRVKAALYAEAGVPEYWIVIPERRVIEVYTQPRDGRYGERRIFAATDGGTLASTAVPALRLDLATFFADPAQVSRPG